MTAPLKFVNHSIDDFAMKVTYRPETHEGRLVYNLSLVRNEDLEFAIGTLRDASKTRIAASGLVKFYQSGERVDDFVVPGGQTAICTVCSVTFDGLLIRRGVPINPIGGGIVEIENRTPIRFTHMILYEYTTIDPLQVLNSLRLTSVTNVMRRGSGNILANIREFHMEAESLVGEVLDEISDSSFIGVLEVGMPNVSLLGVPVSPQFIAIACVGGTNPIAAIREGGRWVQTHAMKGMMDVSEMIEIRNY
jgi:repressor of nif and glnA expression